MSSSAQAVGGPARLAPALTSVRSAFGAPLSAATWRAFAQAPIGFVWCLALGVVTITAVATFGGLILIGIGLPLLTWSLLGISKASALERDRLATQLGLAIPPPVYRTTHQSRRWYFGTKAILTDPRRWAEVAYFALAIPLTVLEFLVIGVLGGAAIGAFVVPFLRARADGLPSGDWLAARTAAADSGAVVAAVVVGGILLVWLAPIALQAATRLHARAALALLGPSHEQQVTQDFTEQVATLRATRTQAVDAADAERRRIERDLHDGAQQRLVALGVELGMAKRAASTDPDAATEALDHAHGEVKEILAELRDLVRGIHPAILTDRGLDAALAGLAARSPIPVDVEIDNPASLAGLDQSRQAAAYFIVAEALTNTTRHSGATRAIVGVAVRGDRLTLSVADDGHGGAELTPGGGLEGLQARVAALDGTFTLLSPPAGGTHIEVVI